MTLALSDILSGMRDNQSVVVVSHAAAICAYLMELPSCEVTVTDVEAGARKIVWKDRTLCDGSLPMPSYFVLTFKNGKLVNLDYHIR